MLKGSTFSQMIGILGALYLAKLYGDEVYGTFAIFSSILNILFILFTLNLDNVLVLSKTKREANTTLVKIVSLAFLFLFLALGIVFGITNLFHLKEEISSLLYLSVFGGFIFTLKSNCEYYFTFAKKFKIIANAKILYAILTLVTQFIFYKMNLENGLIFGFIIATCIVILSYTFFLEKEYFLKKESYANIKSFYKTNHNLIRFGLPSNLINAFANHILTILIGSFFSTSAAGVYGICMKILNIPLVIISSSVSQVFYQKAVDYHQNEPSKLFNFTKKIIRNNVLAMLGVILLTNTLGGFLLEWFFGKSWENLNLYLAILSILVFGRIFFNPISSLLVIFDKLKLGLVFNSTLLAINLLGIYIGYLFQNLVYGITILSVFGSFLYILIAFYFLKLMKKLPYEFN